MAPASVPPFGWIVLAQSLGAFSEMFGQRLGRRCHHRSNIRMLISASTFSAVQAGVILGIGQAVLPVSFTGGQGPLTTWRQVLDHPGLLLNACNNAVYWLALVILLREPLGPLLVVLGFLAASFLVDPLQSCVGLASGGHIPPDAAVLGVLGAALCVVELPWRTLCVPARWCAGCRRYAPVPEASSARAGAVDPDAAAALGCVELTGASTAALSGGSSHTERLHGDGRGADRQAPGSLLPPPSKGAYSPGGPHADDAAMMPPEGVITGQLVVGLFLASAFALLALTTAVGIVFVTYYQDKAGLTSFGYTAVDSMFLPLTMLPLAALLDRSPTLRRWVGEPPWSTGEPCPPHFLATLRRTWAELCSRPAEEGGRGGGAGRDSSHGGADEPVASEASPLRQSSNPGGRPGRSHLPASRDGLCRRGYQWCMYPWPFWFTLAPFHGIEFCRTLLFFWLVTAFDVDATYLQMTLVRVVLVWGVSLMACSVWLRQWVGIEPAEAAATLHPANLGARAAGSVVLLFAVLRLKALL